MSDTPDICNVCGDPHTKLALARRYGHPVDDMKPNDILELQLPCFTKKLRYPSDAELAGVWRYIDDTGKVPRNVATPQFSSDASPSPVAKAPRSPAAPGSFDAMIDARIDAALEGFSPGIDEDKVLALVNAHVPKFDKKSIVELIKEQCQPVGVVITINDAKPVSIEGAVHECVPVLVKLLRIHKQAMIVGPAGSGKTTLVRQAAKALSKHCVAYSFSAGVSEWHLLGRREPGENGAMEYQSSGFVHAFENGGLVLLDEIDAADPNVLVSVNAGLANGYLPVRARTENPEAVRHQDFYVVATANTYGNGADRRYVGRNQLDATTLDRFGGGVSRLEVGYSPAIERSVCPDEDIREWADSTRKIINAKGIPRVLSTRALIAMHQERASGTFTFTESKARYFQDWKASEKNAMGALAEAN